VNCYSMFASSSAIRPMIELSCSPQPRAIVACTSCWTNALMKVTVKGTGATTGN